MLEKEKIDAMFEGGFGTQKEKEQPKFEALKKLAEPSNINHPSHYADGRKYEPIDVIADWNLNFNLGNAVKYISRAGRKDSDKLIEDLKKARFYLDYEINRLEED